VIVTVCQLSVTSTLHIVAVRHFSCARRPRFFWCLQAHANKTTGKQGLGRSSMPKKVAGARWQGTKTKLGSDDEEDEQQAPQQQQQQHEAAVDSIAAAAAASGREQYVKNGILIVLPVKKQPAQQQQEQQQEDGKQGKKDKKFKKQKESAAVKQQQEQPAAAGRKRKQQGQAYEQAAPQASSRKAQKTVAVAVAAVAAAAEQPQKSVKWVKLAAKVLEGAPKRRMRIQKLHKQVVAAAGFDVDAPGIDAEALYQQMLKKLRKAEGLQVCEKYVGLAQA
jgi:Pin2-interacting protein X1